jgi:hypothetical protein
MARQPGVIHPGHLQQRGFHFADREIGHGVSFPCRDSITQAWPCGQSPDPPKLG